MKKKVLSLILCLALVLGMAPAALAEEVAAALPFTLYDTDGTVIVPDVDDGYTVFSLGEAAKTVRFAINEGVDATFGADCNVVRVGPPFMEGGLIGGSRSLDNRAYLVSHMSGDVGPTSTTVTLYVGEESYEFRITFRSVPALEAGLYAGLERHELTGKIELTGSSPAAYQVSYPFNGVGAVYYYLPSGTLSVSGDVELAAVEGYSGVYQITPARGGIAEGGLIIENGPSYPIVFFEGVTEGAGLYGTMENGTLTDKIELTGSAPAAYHISYAFGGSGAVYYYLPSGSVSVSGDVTLTAVDGLTSVYKITPNSGGVVEGTLSIADGPNYPVYFYEGGAVSGQGMYQSLENGMLADVIELTGSAPAAYQISYPFGENGAVYYYLPSGTVSVSGNITLTAVDGLTGVYKITPNDGGAVEGALSIADGPNYPVYFYEGGAASEGLYQSLENGVVSGEIELTGSAPAMYQITYLAGEYPVVYFYSPARAVTGDGNVSTKALGSGVYAVWPKVGGGSGNLVIENGPSYPISFTAQPVAAHTLKDEEKRPAQWADYEGMAHAGPKAFQYNNNTYYIGFGGDQPDMYGGSWPDWYATEVRYTSIGFWTKDNQGNYFAVAESLKSELLAAFGETISIDVYAMPDRLGVYSQQKYPAVSAGAGSFRYEFTNENAGDWLFVLNGEVNGQSITVLASWGYQFVLATTYEAESVADANRYLADVLENGAQERYVVQLPAGTVEGIIEIPEKEGLWNFTICGTVEDGELKTTLKGGVVASAGFCKLEDLILQGAGKNKDTWPENSGSLAGKPNVGLSGTTNAYYDGCMFRDYYMAVTCTDNLRFGGIDTQFIGNHVGIYVDTNVFNGGSTGMMEFCFKENDIALWLKHLNPDFFEHLPLSSYQISSTRFIDNGQDIKNELGRKYFVTGNYFEHEGNTTAVVDTGKWTSGPVFICPVYTVYDEETGEFSELYWGKNSTMSNDDTGKYPIPKGKMHGKLTVIDQPDTEGETSVTFDFGEEETQEISTFSLRRSRAAEETFDATVDIVKSDTTISLTINALPDGKTPTITVPCGEWSSAVVTFDGEEVDSSFADGAVSFVAEQGGTYVIEIRYVVSFDSVGGSKVDSQLVAPEGVAVAPANPKKTGYVFRGWYVGETKYDFDMPVTADVTLMAQWTYIYVNVGGGGVSGSGSSGNTITTSDSVTGVTAETTTGVDGTVTSISATIPASMVDKTVLLPVTPVPADGTVSVTVDVPVGGASVELPVKDVTPGTVAVVVTADGTESVVKDCGITADGVVVVLDKDTTFKVMDKSVDFSDVPKDGWYSDAVSYVSARGLFGGVGNGQFDLFGTTTRSTLMTVLARLAGVDTSGGASWDEKGIEWAKKMGISDGTDPNGTITREQLAVMLWRFAGSPDSNHSLDSFSDDHELSDWAVVAMRWANENGIIKGDGDGKLNPKGVATRSEVAQMLMNFCQRNV